MASPEDLVERKLRQLGTETEALRPPAGLEQRIIALAERRSGTRWLDVPWRLGGLALAVGALAAAASVLFALHVQSDLDEKMLTASDWVEVEP